MRAPCVIAQLTRCARLAALSVVFHAGAADEEQPGWAKAHRQPPMTAAETRTFMKRLAQFVFDHHLKQTPGSEQRGMIYEYFRPAHKGQADRFAQGEALDTMHDGAWFAAALVNAYRATGDPFYKEFLTTWVLPFYCKMLNHSDTLFSAKRNDAAPEAKPWGKEWAFQEGEKGFVPYWWDDGGSVSLERRQKKAPLGSMPCTDLLAGKPNPEFLLNGYSHGSSNHMAQDLAVMVQQAWLLLRESANPADRKLAAAVAGAARNLHECRMHHFNHIPMCCAAFGLTNGNATELKRIPAAEDKPVNHYWRALRDFSAGERRALPGFADDQQYRYYFGIAKHGGRLPRALAFKTIYDAYTEPMLYRYYCDDAAPPAGINRFDLHTFYVRDGRLEDYRSDRKGPFKQPRPIGSRMGPQNMVCCGWALQALRTYPGIWERASGNEVGRGVRVCFDGEPARVEPGGVTLNLRSTRLALEVQGRTANEQTTIRLFSRPDAQGSHAIITLRKDGTATAANDQGESLRMQARITRNQSGITFAVSIPYTVSKEQTAAWANGVEHGRYSVQVGDATRNFLLASSEAQVKMWLEHELAGGLRTWEAIFNEKGYIPTGLGAHTILPPDVRWDQFSDSGGYAHLISAAAQWILYLEGKNDWEAHHVPSVSDPN